jgi:NADH dehydrogenase (ubiquinone) 1 alpha subcomplex subunit 2
VEEAVPVEGLTKADVAKRLEELVKRGESMPRSAESEGELAKA